MKRWVLLSIFFFILNPLQAAAEGFLDFTTPGGRIGWDVKGAAEQRSGPSGWEVLGGAQVFFFAPPDLIVESGRSRILKIRLAIASLRRGIFLWREPGGQRGQIPLSIALEPGLQELTADLADSPLWRGRVGEFVLAFEGHPGPIILKDLHFGPWSFGGYLRDQAQGLFRKRWLNPGTINGLSSPPLFGRTLAYCLNLAAFILVLITVLSVLMTSKSRRKQVVLACGCWLLAIWLISDLRETLELGRTVREVYSFYLRPPPEEKTFPMLGGFYRFADFCRDVIPPESVFAVVPYPYWPFDVRLKNLLYPARMDDPSTHEYLSGIYPRYLVVYRRPEYTFDLEKGQIFSREKDETVSGSGRLLARYDPSSFIFLEEAP